MTKEIKSLTGLRGVAAMWIVLHHYFGSAKTGNIVLEAISNIFSNGYLAVDFFFVLSSFVLCYSYEKSFSVTVNRESYKNFMIKRFIRIYPLLIFMLLFSFIVLYRQHWIYFPYYISLTFIFLSETYRKIDSLAITWSLACEFVLYFIFPFLFLLFTRYKNLLKFVIPISALLYLYIFFADTITLSGEGFVRETIHNSKGLINTPYGTSAIIRCFSGYLLGILSFHYYKSGKSFNTPLLILLIILSLLIKKADIVILICIAFLLPSLINKSSSLVSNLLSSKVIYFLGTISYSIYLIHIVPLILIDMFKNDLLNFLPLYVYKVVGVVLTISFSILTYYNIEKRFSLLLNKYLIKIK